MLENCYHAWENPLPATHITSGSRNPNRAGVTVVGFARMELPRVCNSVFYSFYNTMAMTTAATFENLCIRHCAIDFKCIISLSPQDYIGTVKILKILL